VLVAAIDAPLIQKDVAFAIMAEVDDGHSDEIFTFFHGQSIADKRALRLQGLNGVVLKLVNP